MTSPALPDRAQSCPVARMAAGGHLRGWQGMDGRIKGRDVRLGRGVLFQWVRELFCDVR